MIYETGKPQNRLQQKHWKTQETLLVLAKWGFHLGLATNQNKK